MQTYLEKTSAFPILDRQTPDRHFSCDSVDRFHVRSMKECETYVFVLVKAFDG